MARSKFLEHVAVALLAGNNKCGDGLLLKVALADAERLSRAACLRWGHDAHCSPMCFRCLAYRCRSCNGWIELGGEPATTPNGCTCEAEADASSSPAADLPWRRQDPEVYEAAEAGDVPSLLLVAVELLRQCYERTGSVSAEDPFVADLRNFLAAMGDR